MSRPLSYKESVKEAGEFALGVYSAGGAGGNVAH